MIWSELTLGQPASERLSTRIILIHYPDESGRNQLLGLIAERATEIIRRESRDFVDPGLKLETAPYLGPVLMDGQGPIQLVHEQRLLSDRVRNLLFCRNLWINPMSLVENLLRKTIGLHSPTIGTSMVERAVRLRMRAHGLTKQEDYVILLEQSPTEWDALLDSVLVTETCFFRDKTPFLAMVGLVLNEWSPAHPDRVLRVLSVPCASGEEPYSIAMGLLDAGFPEARLQIDAVDISVRALASARRAVYSKNSFRGRDFEFSRQILSSLG